MISVGVFNFKVLLLIICLFLVSFLLGKVISLITKVTFSEEAFFNAFSTILVGSLCLIVAHALYVTGGKTIQVGFVLIGVIRVFSIKKNSGGVESKKSVSVLKPLITLGIIVVVLYLLQSLLFYNNPFNNIPHGDYSFYSTIIEGYHFFGVETRQTVIDTLAKNYNPSMYHHTDLWLGSIFYSLGVIDTIEAYVMGAHIYLLSLMALGLMALAKNFSNSKFLFFISPFLVMFYGVPFWNIIPQMQTFIQAVGFTPKNTINGLFLLPAMIMLFNKNKLFYVPLLCLPILNIINLPAIFGSLILFGFLGFFIKKIQIDSYKEITIYPIIISLFIVLFYSLAPSANIPSSKEFDIKQVIEGLMDYPLKPLYIVAGSIASILFIYLLPMALLFVNKKVEIKTAIKNQQNYFPILFVISFGVIGLFTWALINILKDSSQIFYLPFVLSFNILLIILFFKSFNKNNKARLLFSGTILLMTSFNYAYIKKNDPFVSFYNQTEYRSEGYLNSIKTILEKKRKPITIAYIVDTSSFNNFWMAIPYHQPDRYIKSIIGGVRQISLSTQEIPINNYTGQERLTLEKEVTAAPFSNYVSKLKEQSLFTDISSSQKKFLVEYRVPFLIVDRNVLYPKDITPLVKKIIVDDLSGEKFIVLNYN